MWISRLNLKRFWKEININIIITKKQTLKKRSFLTIRVRIQKNLKFLWLYEFKYIMESLKRNWAKNKWLSKKLLYLLWLDVEN